MSTLTDQELRATLYFAVGVTSESGYSAFRLVVAGDNPRTPAIEPADNSGYTIGTIQTDLGQHYQPGVPNGENVPRDLVETYQVWARANQPHRALDQEQTDQAIADLGRNGRTIRSQAGRALDAEVQSRLDSYLSSDDGIRWVHGRDVAQINKLMDRAIAPLQRSELYRTASLDDQVELAAMVGKAYNQNESRSSVMIRNIESNRYQSVLDVKQAVDGLSPQRTNDYFEQGRDKALLGANVVNALRNADEHNPLAAAWSNVLSDPLVDPTMLGASPGQVDLRAEYSTIKNLFLHYDRAEGFIGALDRGGAYQNAAADRSDPTRFNGAGFYVAGNDLVNWNRDGRGQAFLDGSWSEVERVDLSRSRTSDGSTDLNIDEGGHTRRLLHIDPRIPALRPLGQDATSRIGPDDPAHQDHAMLMQIRDGVQRLGIQAGVPFDDSSERLCRSLLAACKDSRDQHTGVSGYSMASNALTHVQHVVAGPDHVFVVQGRLDDPAQLRAGVPVLQAMQTPVEHSDAKLFAANEAITQEAALAQQRGVLQSQNQSADRTISA